MLKLLPRFDGTAESRNWWFRTGRLSGLLLCLSALASSMACGDGNSNANGSGPKGGPASSGKFTDNLPAGLAVPGPSDPTGRRLLADYGAMFVARGGASPPPVIIFTNDSELNRWQQSIATSRETFGTIEIELQAPAMTALLAARQEAREARLDITPRGKDAAKRSFAETVSLWKSRVNPGLDHWVKEGRLPAAEAARIRNMSAPDQIPEILRLEDQRLYFSKDFTKSILYSVAAPGSSQHLSMLALDVSQYDNRSVREILARHGWFQTVSSDTPHFTFLGVTEAELPGLGLKRVDNSGQTFWVPDLE